MARAGRSPAALLVAPQPGRRPGRRQAPSGWPRRLEIVLAGPRRRRRAGDRHAPGHDQPDGHGQGRCAQLRDLSAKPILAAWLGGSGHARGGRHLLTEAGVADLPHARTGRTRLHDPGRLRPQPGQPVRNAQGHAGRPSRPTAASLRGRFTSLAWRPTAGACPRTMSKALLEAYGIPASEPRPAATAMPPRSWPRRRSAIRWC